MCKPAFFKVSSIINPLEQRVAKEVYGVITEKYLWANETAINDGGIALGQAYFELMKNKES